MLTAKLWPKHFRSYCLPYQYRRPVDGCTCGQLRFLHVRPGSRDSIQYRARHANGSWVALEVVAYNLLDHPVIQGVLISGRDISNRKRDEAVKDQLIWELKQTLDRINALSGVLPICASCKKIQKDDGNWEQLELYIRERAGGIFPRHVPGVFAIVVSGTE